MKLYLGIPKDINGSKWKLFAFLKKRLQKRVNGWTWRWLSKERKEVMLLPLETCENLSCAIAQFWCNSNPSKKVYIGQNRKRYIGS